MAESGTQLAPFSPGDLWSLHWTELLFVGVEVLDGGHNVAVHSKVGHEVVAGWRIRLVLGVPEVA